MKTRTPPQLTGHEPAAPAEDRGRDDGDVRPEQATGRKTNAAEAAALERLLEALQCERLTPIELRILLRVTDGEKTSAEIAQSMRQPPSMVRRACTRLVARGLLRRHRRRGRPLKLTLSATGWGTSAEAHQQFAA